MFDIDMEEIKWWIEDNVVLFIVLLVVPFILFVGSKLIIDDMNEGVPQTPEEIIEYLVTESEDLKDTFSLLNKTDLSVGDTKYSVYEISLYNKKPFITQGELQTALNNYIDLIKFMDKEDGKTLRAVRFKLYDRKILYDLRLEPKGVFEYRIANSNIKDEDILTTESGTQYETLQEAGWRLTTLNDKKPNYDNYRLEGRYQHLKQQSGVEPLSDQEFEWYLKYDKYRVLKEPTQLYLRWDLGASARDSVNVQIKRQFQAFQNRLSAIGDITNYYTYKTGVKRELIITNPQLLYFAEFNRVAKDDYEARQLLVEDDPNMYESVVRDWLEGLAAEQVNNGVNNSTDTQMTESLTDTESMGSTDTIDNTDTTDTSIGTLDPIDEPLDDIDSLPETESVESEEYYGELEG